MSIYIDHTKKSCIKLIRNTCGMMLNDAKSFVYLRSEGINELKIYSLGGGNLMMVISQFAILNYLAKIFTIAQQGEKAYWIKEDIKDYENKILEFRSNCSIAWEKINKYLIKPRLWEIKNETEAFVALIMEYPDSLGIPKDERLIRKIWRDYRNKLSHIATIANENMSLSFEFERGTTYGGAMKQLKNIKQKQKSFFIRSFDEKKRLEREIITENNKKGMPTSTTVIAQATADQVRPDILIIDIENIVKWIIKRINTDQFDDENIKVLYEWLLMQHYYVKR